MNKELTEQWRDGTLPQGYYYTKITNMLDKERIMIDYYIPELHHFEVMPTEYVKEVIVEAPSYEEYQDIIQQNVNQESAIETYIEDIKRLQEQLNEANKTIKKAQELCPDKNVMLMCNPARPSFGMMTNDVLTNYLEKWGVK